MQTSPQHGEQGNVLLCVVCTILIVSIIGGNILLNCVTRFNAASSQVRGWKESLYAAEAGGDLAYAEIRKTILDRTHAFASGWTQSGTSYTSSPVNFRGGQRQHFFGNRYLLLRRNRKSMVPVRVKGTAPLLGPKTCRAWTIVWPSAREAIAFCAKIDFNYDHFVAAYGPNGDGVGKTLVQVANPQLSRRIELVSAPITPFEAAIKAGRHILRPGFGGLCR